MNRRSMRPDTRPAAAKAGRRGGPLTGPGAASMSAEKRRRILTHDRAIRNFHRRPVAFASALRRASLAALMAFATIAPWNAVAAQDVSPSSGAGAIRVLLQRAELGPSVDADAAPGGPGTA